MEASPTRTLSAARGRRRSHLLLGGREAQIAGCTRGQTKQIIQFEQGQNVLVWLRNIVFSRFLHVDVMTHPN